MPISMIGTNRADDEPSQKTAAMLQKEADDAEIVKQKERAELSLQISLLAKMIFEEKLARFVA